MYNNKKENTLVTISIDQAVLPSTDPRVGANSDAYFQLANDLNE